MDSIDENKCKECGYSSNLKYLDFICPSCGFDNRLEPFKKIINGFFEDYDGEIVLGDTRNFKDAQDFVEQAEKYVKETRGYRIPVLQPSITEIKFDDEEWKPADDPDFEGETITVYCSDLDFENKEV